MIMEGMIKKILFGIIFLIMAVTIAGTTITIVDNEADDLTQDQRCGEAGCFFNSSRTVDCTANNLTASDTDPCGTATANQVYPLEGLFNTGGVVTLVVLGLFLMIAVAIGINMYKKR